MGIKQLMSLLQEKAPGCISKIMIENLTGRTIAIDASMVMLLRHLEFLITIKAMYQFLIATQGINYGSGLTELTDKEGNKTAY